MRQVKGSQLVANVGTLEALAGLLGVPRRSLQLTKLFSTRDSGWTNVSAFHSSCDGKGPTVVLLRSSDGNSYGGYTSLSWASTNGYEPDPQAFLFRLFPEADPRSGQHVRTEKFPISAPGANAILASTTQGPNFGADLVTFTNRGLSLSMQPSSYPTSVPLINSSVPKDTNNFQLEVLQVSVDPNGTDELEVPWLAGVTWAVEVCQCSLHKARCALAPIDMFT